MAYFLDLFAGIGGFALGAEWAGMHFDKHYFSEVDEYAISVYRKRFPDAIALGDIRAISSTDLPSGEWIIAGGFPCQDISVAGKGAGLEGERSGLWYEYARLISEIRPRYAIMENVGALAFRGLDSVLGSLAALGYDAEWQDIRASDVGAPHRRERLWIVAYPDTWNAQCGSSKGPGICSTEGGKRADDYPCGSGSTDVADTQSNGREPWRAKCEGLKGQASLIGRCSSLANEEQVRFDRRGTKDGGREWWATEPDVGRVAYGISSRVDRLKCLGNSIVPQIAELIFKQLLAHKPGVEKPSAEGI